ncbi:response regulator receiver [Thiohalobacter thiocyanaticus]|uniref:Response regulator receiver n=1 Tax=Thiohalobacter thiocyanaticus TaxID=585455 RepID=A0A1Z4VQC2_9GAMM|nr:response regulator [Thiohalobacter thiocyanaticus]BAZ93821.1 response regulator receiver [Thiohalobacter thiocyanaticus]
MTIHTVLVVDDSPSARLVLTKQLRSLGYEVEQAGSGEQALTAIARERPGAVFIDHDLRGISGFETALEIASRAATADIPVVMMTTNLCEDFSARARAHGAVAVMAKGPDASGLAQLLDGLQQADHVSTLNETGGGVSGRPDSATVTRIGEELRRDIREHLQLAVTSAWIDAEQGVIEDIPRLVQRLRPVVEQALGAMIDELVQERLELHLRGVMEDYTRELTRSMDGAFARLRRGGDDRPPPSPATRLAGTGKGPSGPV